MLAGLAATPLMPAAAAPGEQAARSARDAVAARIQVIEKQVASAEDSLERMTIEAEAASDAVLKARAELAAAQREAEATAAALAEAEAAVEKTQDDVADLGREAYMGEDSMSDVAVLLDSEGPGEMLQRAATLELLGDDRARTLEALEVVESRQDRADRAARSAVEERDAAAHSAAEAEKKVSARLAEAQASFDEMTAKRARLDEQLERAEIRLLELERRSDPVKAHKQAKKAEQAAEAAVSAVRTSGGTSLTNGRVTSCYGPRWGTMHQGVDIAAPIGTPVYTPEAGVVLEAGPASGFGQAVYVQHSDGTITLYGHVSRFHVSAGQTVTAGQLVADVGNEGQSTGPHLHFEVHTGGLYANRVNPMSWLSSRGISLGGC